MSIYWLDGLLFSSFTSLYNLKAKYHMSDMWLLKIFILWAVSLLSCFPCCAGAVNCMHSCLSSLAIVSWYWNLFLEYLRLCLYLEVKTWLQWFTLFIMGVLKLLKMELLLLFLSWQVRYWYIRNLLVLYVDFCVLLLCWKFSESAHRDNFTSTFVICTFSFHSALGKISRTMVNKNGEKGHPSLLPDLRRCFLSPCNITLTRSLSNMVSIKLMYAPSISGFLGGIFIMGGF